jgi:SAM-dependent methyltransferase
MNKNTEVEAIRERYRRRANTSNQRYSVFCPDVQERVQERQRVMLRMLLEAGIGSLTHLDIFEVGCGTGNNLLELLMLGAAPERVVGNELLTERIAEARTRLPGSVRLIEGNALQLPFEEASFDLVLQFTVFSSLLDNAFQQQLADVMWRWVKPGGGVLWYDFTIDNPRNADVRGVPLARVRKLFPHGQFITRRVTLAPPLARLLCRVHPALYTCANTLPLLRTHLLCWIAKPLPSSP